MRRWFETPSLLLWRHRNGKAVLIIVEYIDDKGRIYIWSQMWYILNKEKVFLSMESYVIYM